MTNHDYLEFNDHQIAIVAADGTHWVALKPLCEALGVDFKSQRTSLRENEELCQLASLQKSTGSDGKTYDMLCLPYRVVYGYLFSIRSNSSLLKDYRMKCYNVLYDYFHLPSFQSERNGSEAEPQRTNTHPIVRGEVWSRRRIQRVAAAPHVPEADLKEALAEFKDQY